MRLRLSPTVQTRLDSRRDKNAHLPGFGGSDMERHVFRAMLGRFSPEIHETIRTHAIQGKLRLDAITAALMSHLGLNPALMAMLEFVVGNVEVIDAERCVEEATIIRMADDGSRVVISQDPPVLWDAKVGGFLLSRMPETVINAAIGRPLADLLTHPALDPFGLRITGRRGLPARPHLGVMPLRWLSGREIAAQLEDPTC